MKVSLQIALIPMLFFFSACSKPGSRKNQQNSTSQRAVQKPQVTQNREEVLPPTRQKREQSNRVPPKAQQMEKETQNESGSSASIKKEAEADAVNGASQSVPPGPGAPILSRNEKTAGSSTVRIQDKPQSSAVSEAQNQVAQASAPKKESQSDSARDAKPQARAKAQNSDEIKKQETVKLSFQNLNALRILEQKEGFVLYKGQTIDQKLALNKLLQANEEHFCAVKGSELFHTEDYLRFEGGDDKALDEKNGIYQTTLIFENSNGQLSIVCTHTTSRLFLEDVRLNFEKYLQFVDLDGRTENPPDYINPGTEDRFLRAVRIQDLEKFKKIVVQPHAKENFSMTKGAIGALEASINAVQAQKETMTCFVHEVLGNLDAHKTFVQVQTGIAQDTPRVIPTAGIYHIYLADPDNGFILYCVQAKRAPLKELFSTMKDVLKFGVLERKEYSKKREELMRIHKERSQTRAAK